MTDNSLDLPLAGYGEGVVRAHQAVRRKTLPAAGRWLLVFLIHAVFFTIFILAEEPSPPPPVAMEETTLLLPPLHPARTTMPAIRSVGPRPTPEIRTQAITLPPMLLAPPLPQSDEDILRAIGEALACGASSYENLSEYGRENCRRIPWIPMREANGDIGLGPPPEQAPQTFNMTGAEAVRHEMQTAPVCPKLVNVPCLSQVITGRGNLGP